jgi:hypothetical protein
MLSQSFLLCTDILLSDYTGSGTTPTRARGAPVVAAGGDAARVV